MTTHTIDKYPASLTKLKVTLQSNFFSAVSKQYKCHISELVSNNGIKFGGQQLHEFLGDQGCKHSTSASYHHSQNGTAGQAIGLISQKACTMLIDAMLPCQLWPKAVKTVLYLANCSPPSSNPEISHNCLHSTLDIPYLKDNSHLKAYGANLMIIFHTRSRKLVTNVLPEPDVAILLVTKTTQHIVSGCRKLNKVIWSAHVWFNEDPCQIPAPAVSHSSPQDVIELLFNNDSSVIQTSNTILPIASNSVPFDVFMDSDDEQLQGLNKPTNGYPTIPPPLVQADIDFSLAPPTRDQSLADIQTNALLT
jgi:hypothetical protein